MIAKTVLVVGLLINLIKACDVFLTDAHKARLQSAFETFTLRLDYARPLTLIPHLRRWPFLAFAVLASLLVTWAGPSLDFERSPMAPVGNTVYLLLGSSLLFFGWMHSVLLLSIIGTWKGSKPIVSTLAASGSVASFARRAVWLHLVSVAFLILLWGGISRLPMRTARVDGILLSYYATSEIPGWNLWLLVGGCFFAVPLVAWNVIAAMVLVSVVGLWLAERTSRATSWLCYRIAAYNKGALAGVTATVTIGLILYQLITLVIGEDVRRQ